MTETSRFPGSQYRGSQYGASQYGDEHAGSQPLDSPFASGQPPGDAYPTGDQHVAGQYPPGQYPAVAYPGSQHGSPYPASEPGGDDDYGDAGNGEQRPELVELIDELISVVERAKSMPLSSSAIISRDEVLGLLAAAHEALPVELLNARRVLQDHEELRQRAEREAAEVLDEARSQAQYMVQRTEVVRQARHQAERIVEDAEADARRVRHEADDYVDRKLASFEIVLDRTMRTVRAGRERLAVVPSPLVESDLVSTGGAAEDAFFDQDQS